jgi:hypothetical protein
MSDFVFDDMPPASESSVSQDPFGGGGGGEENLAWSQPADQHNNTFGSSEPQAQWSSGGGNEAAFMDNDQHQHQHHEEQQSSWQMPEPEQDDALSAFNKQWQVTLDAKRAAEMEAEKAVKAKAAEEMANWHAQRDIRLRAKKVCGLAGRRSFPSPSSLPFFFSKLFLRRPFPFLSVFRYRLFCVFRMQTGAKSRSCLRRSSRTWM